MHLSTACSDEENVIFRRGSESCMSFQQIMWLALLKKLVHDCSLFLVPSCPSCVRYFMATNLPSCKSQSQRNCPPCVRCAQAHNKQNIKKIYFFSPLPACQLINNTTAAASFFLLFEKSPFRLRDTSENLAQVLFTWIHPPLKDGTIIINHYILLLLVLVLESQKRLFSPQKATVTNSKLRILHNVICSLGS